MSNLDLMRDMDMIIKLVKILSMLRLYTGLNKFDFALSKL